MIEENSFCDQKWKTLVAFLFLVIALFISLTSLAITHDRLPDRNIYKPLPDIILDHVGNFDFWLNVTEIQIMVIVNVCVILILFHKYR